MDISQTGGPAFPVDNVVQRDEKGYLVGCEISSAGMTLRDYFAAKAMQAMCEETMAKDFEWCARRSYAMADAMIKARG